MRRTTTIPFRGILKKFMIVALDSSGMYLLLIVPRAGQKIPTVTSNAKNDKKIRREFEKKIGTERAMVLAKKTKRMKDSGSAKLMRVLKKELPIITLTINVAKIHP